MKLKMFFMLSFLSLGLFSCEYQDCETCTYKVLPFYTDPSFDVSDYFEIEAIMCNEQTATVTGVFTDEFGNSKDIFTAGPNFGTPSNGDCLSESEQNSLKDGSAKQKLKIEGAHGGFVGRLALAYMGTMPVWPYLPAKQYIIDPNCYVFAMDDDLFLTATSRANPCEVTILALFTPVLVFNSGTGTWEKVTINSCPC